MISEEKYPKSYAKQCTSLSRISGSVNAISFNAHLPRALSSPAADSHMLPESMHTKVQDVLNESSEDNFGEISLIMQHDDKDSMETTDEMGGWKAFLQDSPLGPWLPSYTENGLFQQKISDQDDDFEEVSARIHEHKNTQGNTPACSGNGTLPNEWDVLTVESPAADFYSSDDNYLQLPGSTDQEWSSISDSNMSISEDSVDEPPLATRDESSDKSFGFDDQGQGSRELSTEKQVTGLHMYFLVVHGLRGRSVHMNIIHTDFMLFSDGTYSCSDEELISSFSLLHSNVEPGPAG